MLGPEVEAFEAEFAAASGASHAVGVGNGTDAIALMLRAMNVRRGDEVIVPAITAAYTGLAVILAGGTPVFADVDPETLTLDPSACEAAITSRTVAIVPVHLYGQPAAMQTLQTDCAAPVACDRRGLLPGAPRHVRRRSSRHAERRRRVQLLSDKEPGSARRRRRRHHQ